MSFRLIDSNIITSVLNATWKIMYWVSLHNMLWFLGEIPVRFNYMLEKNTKNSGWKCSITMMYKLMAFIHVKIRSHARFSFAVLQQRLRDLVSRCIPMRINCAPLLADLFLYSIEDKFTQKRLKESTLCLSLYKFYICRKRGSIFKKEIDLDFLNVFLFFLLCTATSHSPLHIGCIFHNWLDMPELVHTRGIFSKEVNCNVADTGLYPNSTGFFLSTPNTNYLFSQPFNWQH